MIPHRIGIHHSLTKDSQTVSTGAIRKWHRGLIGQSNLLLPNYNYYVNHPMKDIGYHALLELVNDYYEIIWGRMLNEQGAHIQRHNDDSLGICFIGNFDIDEVHPEQWNNGIKLVTSLCHIFMIPTERIKGHRELDPTKTCPGINFNMDGFRLQVGQGLKF